MHAKNFGVRMRLPNRGMHYDQSNLEHNHAIAVGTSHGIKCIFCQKYIQEAVVRLTHAHNLIGRNHS